MKAMLVIRKIRENKYIVVIDNGYGNELTLTDHLTFDEARNEVSKFYENAEFVIEE